MRPSVRSSLSSYLGMAKKPQQRVFSKLLETPYNTTVLTRIGNKYLTHETSDVELPNPVVVSVSKLPGSGTVI